MSESNTNQDTRPASLYPQGSDSPGVVLPQGQPNGADRLSNFLVYHTHLTCAVDVMPSNARLQRGTLELVPHTAKATTAVQ